RRMCAGITEENPVGRGRRRWQRQGHKVPPMEYRTFGRTNLRVSIVGVGTGGASRRGLSTGSTEDEAVDLIHRAIELGINYFDTAENYKNEHVLGRAVEHR